MNTDPNFQPIDRIITVGDLIKELQNFDPTRLVKIPDNVGVYRNPGIEDTMNYTVIFPIRY
jgi:hypothetical protein